MAGSYFSHRRARRKRRQRGRDLVHGLLAFVLGLALFLTAAHFNGDLISRQLDQAVQLRPRLVTADELAAAAERTALADEPRVAAPSVRRRSPAPVAQAPIPVVEDALDVLTASELEAISQAGRDFTVP